MYIGEKIKLSLFGESHGKGVGIVIEGLPPGLNIDEERIYEFLSKRRPGKSKISTQRKEEDIPEILSGVYKGKTTGAALACFIRNTDTKSNHYAVNEGKARPSHSDYSAAMRYEGFNDPNGGGIFSGRLTAPIVFMGAIADEILENKGIHVGVHVKSIHDISDSSFDCVNIDAATIKKLKQMDFPIINEDMKEAFFSKILSAKQKGDSVGGVLECACIGMPPGIGGAYFDRLESKIGRAVFSIPSFKGLEFGAGFEIGKMFGSEANDSFFMDNGKVRTKTNNSGGINGGISNGMPIILRVAVRPTPSIAISQETIDLSKKEDTNIEIIGRHDPCIVQRAAIVLCSIVSISILDSIL